jgi:hypothetical protein
MTDAFAIPLTAGFVGANGLIGFALSYIAVNARTRSGVWHGERPDDASASFVQVEPTNLIARMVADKRDAAAIEGGRLQRAVRAHGNFAEYVPLGLLFVLVLELAGASLWLIVATGALLTIGRLIYSVGVLAVYGPSPLRFTGFMMCWAAYLLGSAGCLLIAADGIFV